MARRQDQRPAVLHYRLPEHRDLQAGLRLRLGFRARQWRRHDLIRERPLGTVPQLRRARQPARPRSEEHTSELQSLMRIQYAVFCLKKKTTTIMRVTQDRLYHTN